MMKDENVLELKKICGNPDGFKYDDAEFKQLLEEDPALKYYLLGQFISYIDRFKYMNNKNKDVFSNFVSNVNRNNIKKLFVSEILQKNNFYISQMSQKGKIIFKLFESNIDKLFNESGNFDYEDYLLLIFTGYYTDNILVKDYKFMEGLDD